jgi:outer membrane protein assembly factor BamB
LELGERIELLGKTVCGMLFLLLLANLFAAAFNVQSTRVSASSGGEAAQATDTDWWPMFHHDLTHNGTSTSTAPSTNHTIWSYTVGGYLWSSPAVAGGLVYVGSEDDNVYCLNASDGTWVWNYTTAGQVWSSPAVVSGLVYVGSHDGNVYCLNASTGTRLWNYTTAGQVWSSPAVVSGLVYVGSEDDNVYCLNASTGALIWNYTTGSYVISSPAVAGGYVYVGSYDGNVYCLNASAGTKIWNYTTAWNSINGNAVFSSPAVAGGLVYVGSEDDNVYCLNASTGALVWNYTTGDMVDCSPALFSGLVYVGSEDGNLYCLNASHGALVWKYTTLGQVDCSPAVAGSAVYVGSSDNNVYCLNAVNGTLVWKYATGLCAYSSPALADGMLYFCSEDNNVYCFGSSQTYTYSVTIGAHCYGEGVNVSVPITMDGSPSGHDTPHAFIGLTGTHTFTVPVSYESDQAFLEWNNGQRTTTITVSSGGAYAAYYAATSETLLAVPFHYQQKDYYCGPACLQMVFNYYGQNIAQPEIACVARTIGYPLYTTYTSDLTRAAQFSNISTSMGDQLPYNITGYSLRQLGYSASEALGMTLATLESFLDQGKPLILCMWYSSAHYSGHFRVAVGYNSTCVFLQDPWNTGAWGGAYGGPYTAFNVSQFMDLWSYSGNWALYVSPWEVNLSTPTYFKPGKPFEVQSTITYPAPLPNAVSAYPASSCNATIVLPANLSLAQGELQSKPIGTGLLNASDSAIVTWILVANSSIKGTIGIVAEGKISGSVGLVLNYPAYYYTDRIGAAVNFSIVLNVDNSAPTIGTPSLAPATAVQPYQPVKVSVNVTDTQSGVKNVTLSYTIDNGTTWQNQTMNFNQTASLYETTIPGQEAGTWVRFKITAVDNVGNNATLDGTWPYYTYQTVPEFSPLLFLTMLVTVTLLAVEILRRKRINPSNPNTQNNAFRILQDADENLLS